MLTSTARQAPDRPVNPLRRRLLLGGSLATILSLVNPTIRTGRFQLMRDAEAQYLEVAMLAVSAISSFSSSGSGGVGAYLGNIKALTEENIKLTQEVLARVGQLQSALEQLPERMRRVFVQGKEYELRQGAQVVHDSLVLVERHAKPYGWPDSADRKALNFIIQTCSNLTGSRATPYGRGGIAASCVAVIGAIEARAWWHLRRPETFAERVEIAYLPWFDEILKEQDSSLARMFMEDAQRLELMGKTMLDDLPAALRSALTPSWGKTIVGDPGSTVTLPLWCGGYGQVTGYRDGPCNEQRCTEQLKVGKATVRDRLISRILEANTLPPPESYIGSKGRCWCVGREKIPKITPGGGARLELHVINRSGQLGPELEFVARWRPEAPGTCEMAAQGDRADPVTQSNAVMESSSARTWLSQLEKFRSGPLAAYNTQRMVVYSDYLLLDATRSARAQFASVRA